MANIIVPSKRIIQPKGLTKPSTLAESLNPKLLTSFHDARNVVTGANPANITNVKGVTSNGVGLLGNGTVSGGKASYNVSLRGQQMLLVASITPYPYTNTFPFICETTSNANNNTSLTPFWFISYINNVGTATSTSEWSALFFGSAGGYSSASFPAPTAGRAVNIVIAVDLSLGGLALSSIHANGVKQALFRGATTLSPASVFGTNDVYIGHRGDHSIFGTHTQNAFGLFSKLPDEATQKALSVNPWQLFAPQKRVVYFDLAAGGGDVTANTSLPGTTLVTPSASASGNAVTTVFVSSATLIPNTGQASGTGSAVGSNVTLTLIPNTGQASGTGSAVGSNVTLTLIPNTGQASGTGSGNGTAQGTTLSLVPNAGQASGTGSGNGTAQGTTLSLVPNTGQASGTGSAVGSTVTLTLIPNTGQASGSGSANGTAQGTTLSLVPNTGSASGTAAVSAAGSNVTLTPVAGQATGSGSANGNAQSTTLSLVPNTGSASGTANGSTQNTTLSLVPNTGSAVGVSGPALATGLVTNLRLISANAYAIGSNITISGVKAKPVVALHENTTLIASADSVTLLAKHYAM